VGTRWQVLSGLAAGDRVLVEGSQRARAGDTVRASEVVPTGANPASKSPGAAASVAGTAVVAAR
jgi:membrane fusion protein (multidrug efflux system)